MANKLALEVGDAPIPTFERYLLGLECDTEVLLHKLCNFIVILEIVRGKLFRYD